MFERSRHNILSYFIIFQDYYELPKKTIRTYGNIYRFFKTNNFRDVQNLYQDKAFMDMTLIEFKYLTSFCWDKKYQPVTIDMNKDRHTGRYRLALDSIFVSLSTITKKLDEVKENTHYIADVIKQSKPDKLPQSQLAIENTPAHQTIENIEGVKYDVEIQNTLENI